VGNAGRIDDPDTWSLAHALPAVQVQIRSDRDKIGGLERGIRIAECIGELGLGGGEVRESECLVLSAMPGPEVMVSAVLPA